MEINNFNELSAINKLLWVVKFQDDFDFDTFREYAQSPIIAKLFQRINKEFVEKGLENGVLGNDSRITFAMDNHFGMIVKRRINETSVRDASELLKMPEENFRAYLNCLVIPLEISDSNFEALTNYARKTLKEIISK